MLFVGGPRDGENLAVQHVGRDQVLPILEHRAHYVESDDVIEYDEYGRILPLPTISHATYRYDSDFEVYRFD